MSVAVLDADRIVSGSADSTLKLWEVSTQRCVATFQGHSSEVWCVAVLDADRIVSGSEDKTLKLWEVSTQRCVATFQGHSSYVRCVTVLDADRIVSGSADSTLKLWEVSTQRDAPGPKSASQEWAAYVAKTKTTSAAMEELMDLVGMEEIKRHALQVFSMMQAWVKLPAKSRVPVTLNFVLMGNPGTGKTTAARIMGRLLHEIGVRRKATFIEKSAVTLKREGGKAFADTIQQALGGVLFIDEAYQLDPHKDPVGRDIVDELLLAAENHREDLTIILAGYKEDIEAQLFAYNPGMASRFDEVTFSDFHDGQLRDIWDRLLREYDWTVTDTNVSNVAVRRVVRQRSAKGFGNARAVRSAFQAAIKTATVRWAADPSSPKLCIVMEDVIGVAPSRHSIPDLDDALRKLDALVGMQEVKQAVHQLVETAATNYRREIRGQPVLHLALNRLMLGNPGTGKTTVAGIYAQVLKALGLVSKGGVELRTASDFVGSHVGESATKTNGILASCKGKVLVIDEAYNLNDSMYGKQVVDTIVEKVMGSPGEDIAVLLVGYEKQMRDMLREQNPGLARRFNPQSALQFPDYDDSCLGVIAVRMCAAEGVELSLPVLRCMVQTLARQRSLPNFGNAGAVANLLSVAKAHMILRVGAASDDQLALTVADVVGEGRQSHGGVGADADPLQPLRHLYASGAVVGELDKLRKFLAVQRREGGDVSAATGNWLFMGNPGTGKTTVAKCMGRMLRDLGVLSTDAVEVTSAADLTGNVVGAAKDLVADAMGRARGGILFIDEAYELGQGSYGQEAMTKLVEMLTLDEYKTSTVVILGGYEDSMHQMLGRNVGLASRFQQVLRFPDWTAEDATGFLMQQAETDGYDAGVGVKAELLRGFAELRTRPGWANARDATNLWRDRVMRERTLRVYDLPEPALSVTLEDVQRALKGMLECRPRGVSRRRSHGMADVEVFSTAETQQRGEHRMPPAPPALEHDHGATCASDAKDQDRFTAEDRVRLQREQEEAERQELQRLEELRVAEELARQQAEEARRRADEEAARRAEEARACAAREAEDIRRKQLVQLRIREMGVCPASFRWGDVGGGWYRCAGGSHTIHVDQLNMGPG